MRRMNLHILLQGTSLAAVSGSIFCGLLSVFIALGTAVAQDQQPPQGAPVAPSEQARPAQRGRRFPMRGMSFGVVTSVGVDRLMVKKNDGSTETVLVDDKTNYREGEKQIALEDLKPGDHVAVRARDAGPGNSMTPGSAPMPDQGATQGTTATPAEWASSQASPATVTAAGVRRVTGQEMQWFQGDRAFGEITAINGNEITVTNPRRGTTQTIEVSDGTTFMKQGSAITINDLKVGDRMMAVGKTANGKLVADRVMVGMPGGGGGFRRPQGAPNP